MTQLYTTEVSHNHLYDCTISSSNRMDLNNGITFGKEKDSAWAFWGASENKPPSILI